MSDEMRVKYPFMSLKYSTYVKIQATLILSLIVGALLLFLYGRDSSVWLMKNGWWMCAILALLEVVESLVAIGKAKKDFAKRNTNNTG